MWKIIQKYANEIFFNCRWTKCIVPLHRRSSTVAMETTCHDVTAFHRLNTAVTTLLYIDTSSLNMAATSLPHIDTSSLNTAVTSRLLLSHKRRWFIQKKLSIVMLCSVEWQVDMWATGNVRMTEHCDAFTECLYLPGYSNSLIQFPSETDFMTTYMSLAQIKRT